MIKAASNNSSVQSVVNIRSMLNRFSEIEAAYDSATVERQEELTAEQDTICRSVVDALREHSDGLDSIISALTAVGKVIECTYDHDSETGERIDEPGEHSGADIVNMLSEIELDVEDAMQAAEFLFVLPSTDNKADA